MSQGKTHVLKSPPRRRVQRLAHLERVSDAGRTVLRVRLQNGQALRDCSMCGLYANAEAAQDHARRHGVRVVEEEAP